MDTIKLEAKWPPDRKSTIEASEFGIYKEPADGKSRRLRGADKATGCLLMLSLMAAAAVVLYFTFFDYTIPTAQAPAASAGPIVNYAKYVKEKQTTANGAGNVSADGLLAAMLGVRNAENHTAAVPVTAERHEPLVSDRIDHGRQLAASRRVRLYPNAASQRPYGYDDDNGYRKTNDDDVAAAGPPDDRLEYSDGLYGFGGRRSDFPQLQAAYRAPFPPKSILDVMKYVTGPQKHRQTTTGAPAEFMIAQESRDYRKYMPVNAAEEINRFLPDVIASPKSGSMRFRNNFGPPPAYLTPPQMTLPDDFMKPPNPDARYSADFQDNLSVDFQSNLPVDFMVHEGAASVPSHTDVVFHPPIGYPVPDAPKSKKVKKKRPKNKKPISVMLDIYPVTDEERENEQENDDTEEEIRSEMFTSIKNNFQKPDRDNLFFRLNLFPNFIEGNRRMSRTIDKEQKSLIHLTTQNPLKNDGNKEADKYEESSELK